MNQTDQTFLQASSISHTTILVDDRTPSVKTEALLPYRSRQRSTFFLFGLTMRTCRPVQAFETDFETTQPDS